MVELDVRRWAQQILTPGAAAILDVETSGLDGSILEIAVLDAATGEVLLDTLVFPGPHITIEPEAQAVHGITAGDLIGAPGWPEVLPLLVEVIGGRVVLAYNAPFDRARTLHDCARTATDPGPLADEDRWQCVMQRRCAALDTDIRIPLGGGHRARGDVEATRALLHLLADGRPDHAGQAALALRQERQQPGVPTR
ncbi:3'-5' exonuclease [Rhodococcus artemisiae]|uniref:3'-5' exonuclease n=1 Tax=Rhodococcus artemisiae TaxID=714159 RepID=A0ABU7LKD3_9NOCA|nr:3'-5' exonuclease [Rhodococcus artemisiae]MEE2061702.1 3'-5' exonuclease [Rhodococcus artemisiae]